MNLWKPPKKAKVKKEKLKAEVHRRDAYDAFNREVDSSVVNILHKGKWKTISLSEFRSLI